MDASRRADGRGRAGGPLVVALVAVALLAACAAEEVEEPDVVVGVGSTVEQQVLAALTVVALEEAGITTEVRSDLGGTIGLRRQARSEAIDVFWDYTGAAWALGLGQQNPPPEPQESYERVRQEDRGNGLVWLGPSQANATLAFFVRSGERPEAPPNGMEWLAGVLSAGERALCVDDDFRRRPGGLQELATEHYLMNLTRVQVVSAGEEEAIRAVAGGECFAGLATATSGDAYNAGLVPLADELRVFPAFVVAPVVRAPALEAVPGITAALAPVVAALDTATLARLNGEAEDTEPEELARRFVAEALGLAAPET
jgi:osmoprotectant transport system substrate-binding protein